MSTRSKFQNVPKSTRSIKEHIQLSIRDAAIYKLLSQYESDDERAADYRRLQEIEMGLARHWATVGGYSNTIATRRLSISLILLKLTNKVVSSSTLARILGRRHLRRVIATSEDIQQYDLRSHAVESTQLLKRLGEDDEESDDHTEHGYLASESGALRAGVLGINDGLVSNLSLVMGVAGGISDSTLVLLAGLAGLVAGALSMAAGEYISVASQREFYSNLVRWERAELILWPKEEETELAKIFQQKGLEEHEAKLVAARIMSEPEAALDVHVREELGIDPDDLGGSPWTAAISSFISFAIGALMPIIPFIFGGEGTGGIAIGAAISAVSLIIVGGGLGWITGIGITKAALRMLLIGTAAAAITYAVGAVIGNQIIG